MTNEIEIYVNHHYIHIDNLNEFEYVDNDKCKKELLLYKFFLLYQQKMLDDDDDIYQLNDEVHYQ